MASREFDLVVYGATGFTGSLVAEHLSKHHPDRKIALAGRSETKLASVRDRLQVDWPLIVADAHDMPALHQLAKRTTAVVTTVGPYAKYGADLASACAAAGTHYADLCGEVLFMRESIDRNQETASASGAKIVHACGFDSIPSDIGTFALHLAIQEDDGVGHLGQTELVMTRMKGGFSGGTVASGVNEMETIRADPAARKIATNPYGLTPDATKEIPKTKADRDLRGVDYDEVLHTYLAPFIMAGVNTRVVRRSNALSNYSYGRDFHYRETLATGPGLKGRAKAMSITATLGAFAAGMSSKPTRSLLERFLPDPGEGPSAEKRAKGSFEATLHTRTPTAGTLYRAIVSAQGDPGYAATAVMLGETGITLATSSDMPDTAGVLTPSTAMGTALINQLQQAGVTITAHRM